MLETLKNTTWHTLLNFSAWDGIELGMESSDQKAHILKKKKSPVYRGIISVQRSMHIANVQADEFTQTRHTQVKPKPRFPNGPGSVL